MLLSSPPLSIFSLFFYFFYYILTYFLPFFFANQISERRLAPSDREESVRFPPSLEKKSRLLYTRARIIRSRCGPTEIYMMIIPCVDARQLRQVLVFLFYIILSNFLSANTKREITKSIKHRLSYNLFMRKLNKQDCSI